MRCLDGIKTLTPKGNVEDVESGNWVFPEKFGQFQASRLLGS
jgi:hypothetical protein